MKTIKWMLAFAVIGLVVGLSSGMVLEFTVAGAFIGLFFRISWAGIRYVNRQSGKGGGGDGGDGGGD